MSRSISLSVVDPSDDSPILDPGLERARALVKRSQYPAGLYGAATFVLPRDISGAPSLLRIGMEVTIRIYSDNYASHDPIYHGWVDDLQHIQTGDIAETRVTLVGDWGKFMERRGIERRWADTDTTQRSWKRVLSASGAELATDDRDERIRITPKAEAWTSGNVYELDYQTPAGELVGKVTCSYDLQEGAQQWELELYNGTTNEFSITATGTGTQDVDLGTADAVIRFEAAANQTPTADGTIYGELSDLIVYAEKDHASRTLGTVNVYEIALDIVDLLGVDETLISSNLAELSTALTLSLVPFVTNGYEMFGSILARAAGYGDASQNSIGYGLRSPFLSPDNLPRLFLETYPDLSDFDYDISVDECDLAVRVNLDDVQNYIIVEYTDEFDGGPRTLTPETAASLTDADSVAAYGRIDKKLVIGLANLTVAQAYGERYLARHAQPTYSVTRPLKVSKLRAANGAWVHAAHVDAGKRLRIPDLPNITGQGSTSGTTFLITATEYSHDDETVSISLGGRPDNLGMWLAAATAGFQSVRSPYGPAY